MKEKTLHNSDISGTRQNVPDVKVYGDGDTFRLWVKASSQSEGWMKTTKVANVPGGALVQTETQQRNSDGSYALSQALVFVPYVEFDHETRTLRPTTAADVLQRAVELQLLAMEEARDILND